MVDSKSGGFTENAKALARFAPDGSRSFVAMHQVVMDDGSISRAMKELMALAISVATGCVSCCEHHLDQALLAGATHNQVGETLSVAVMMGGGPAYTYAATVASKLGFFEDRDVDL